MNDTAPMPPRRRPRPCAFSAPTHALTYARHYPCGYRCDRHSPWALAGWTTFPRPVPEEER